MKKLFTLSLLMLISVSAFADNFSHEARQDRHDTNATHEEMESIYSHQGNTQNIDQRFWDLYNKAGDNLMNATSKVNQTNVFIFLHSAPNLPPAERNSLNALLSQERPLVQKWIEQKNELLNLINIARNGGLDDSGSYEQAMTNLSYTSISMENQIAQRPY